VVSNIYTKEEEEEGDAWVRNWKPYITQKKKGMHGHPQACDFASSCIILFPHHVMFYPKQKKYFHLHDYLGSCKRVSSSKQIIIIVSPKMQDPQIIKKPSYSIENKH
jgi:hypothetical protein